MCRYKEGLTLLPNLIFNTPPPFPLPLNTQRMPTRVYKSLRYLLKMPGLSKDILHHTQIYTGIKEKEICDISNIFIIYKYYH